MSDEQATTQPLWDDDRIAFRAHNTPTERKAQYVISLLKQMRGDYEAELGRVRAELAEARKPMRVIVQPDFVIDLEDE